MRNIILLIAIYFMFCNLLSAQTELKINKKNLNFKQYMKFVGEHNIDYIAEKYNIKIAEARIEAAKIFQNPNLSVDYVNSRESGISTGAEAGAGIDYTFELGFKRSKRIKIAECEYEQTKNSLQDYYRLLRAEATVAYLEVLKHNYLYKVKESSYMTLKQLSEADSIRLKLGEIAEIDYLQSKLETGILENDVLQAEADMKNAFNKLAVFTGELPKDTVYFPIADFKDFDRVFDKNELLQIAYKNRTDILIAEQNRELSLLNKDAASAERVPDIGLRLGYTNYYNVGVSGPVSSEISFGVSVPLMFSNIYNGDVQAAEIQTLQATEKIKQTRLLIETEINNAYEQFTALKNQLAKYESGMLVLAKNVFEGKIYSYRRGETSLFEALNAQRTFNEIQITYYETLFNYSAAIVELEKSLGIWDL